MASSVVIAGVLELTVLRRLVRGRLRRCAAP